MKALVLSSSPRRDGNSARLANAVAIGLTANGHEAETVYLTDVVGAFLKDCRQCRREDGTCSIDDGYRSLFLDRFLAADGIVAATPVYWYGMAAQLKAFFDRMFCYVAASYPQSEEVKRRMQGKRIGLLLSSEETYPTLFTGIVHQLQEYSRYTHSTFVGVVHGQGNARGEVERDPRDPIAQARQFGRDFFTTCYTDYQIDTPRPSRVWEDASTP
ncbi:flavodoxin family protein [Rhodospirillaceae bacterium SYSU D60014]|uniref:flavodoxin family protein n=1 Tax=Virgifigura deserti TaxID=2268457 RepID=UPI000E661878